MSTDLQFVVERLEYVEKENGELKQKLKKLEEEKMGSELHVADIVYDQKMKMDATRLMIIRYAIDMESWFHYEVGSTVNLVTIFSIVVALVRCTR